MAVLESLGWGVFALLLLALLGRSGLSSVLTVWSRPLTTGGSPLAPAAAKEQRAGSLPEARSRESGARNRLKADPDYGLRVMVEADA